MLYLKIEARFLIEKLFKGGGKNKNHSKTNIFTGASLRIQKAGRPRDKGHKRFQRRGTKTEGAENRKRRISFAVAPEGPDSTAK